MERYDYRSAVTADAKEWILEWIRHLVTNEELVETWWIDNFTEKFEDEMFVSDSVTGNASGSYTFSTWLAEEYLCHNWELVEEAKEEFGGIEDYTPEALDVTIRCYLLDECIQAALEDDDVQQAYADACDRAALPALEEAGYAGTGVSLAESLFEYGFAIKRDGDVVTTLYHVQGEGWYTLRLAVPYLLDEGISIEDDDDAKSIACKLEDAMHGNVELYEAISGDADPRNSYEGSLCAFLQKK